MTNGSDSRRGNYNVVIESEYGRTGFAIASMVLGILSVTLCCAGGWILGSIGFILGCISLAKRHNGKGMAIAGVITSILGILVGVYVFWTLIDCVKSDEFQDTFREAYQESYYEETGEYYDFGE
ncbi:MAG: DUF4190 domain-containing protein [Roseburia sp.]